MVSRAQKEIKNKYISTLGLILPFTLFVNVSLDGVTNVLAILMRGVWQTGLMYFIAIFFIRKMGLLRMNKGDVPHVMKIV
jgi:hypothetical protein